MVNIYNPLIRARRPDFISWRQRLGEERQRRLLEGLQRLARRRQEALWELQGQARAAAARAPLVQALTARQEAEKGEREGKKGGGGLFGFVSDVLGGGLEALADIGVGEYDIGHALGGLWRGYQTVQREGVEPLAGRLGELGESAVALGRAGLTNISRPWDIKGNIQRTIRSLQEAGRGAAQAIAMEPEEARAEFRRQHPLSQFLTSTAADPMSYLGWGLLKQAGLRAAGKPGAFAAIARGLGKGEEKFIRVTNWPFEKVGRVAAKAWRQLPQPTEYVVAREGDKIWNDFRLLADRLGPSIKQTFLTGDKRLTRVVLQEGREMPEYASVRRIIGDIADADPENWNVVVQTLAEKSPREAADWLARQAAGEARRRIDAAVWQQRLRYIREFGVDLAEAAGEAVPEGLATGKIRPSIGRLFRWGGKAVARGRVDALFSNKAQKALRAYILDGWDKIYLNTYRRTLEPYFVRPLSNAVLAFGGFPVMNVIEGAYRQIAGEAGLGFGAPREAFEAFAGVEGTEALAPLLRSASSVGGAAGIPALAGRGWLRKVGQWLGGYFVEASRRLDAAQRLAYVTTRLRTRLAENLRAAGALEDQVMREVIEFANKRLPPELEPFRRFINIRVATHVAQGPDAVRNLVKHINARDINRRAALELLDKYTDLSPSTLRVLEQAIRSGDIGSRIPELFEELALRQALVDQATPEAIAARIDDMIAALPTRKLMSFEDIFAVLGDAHNLEFSTAAYERDVTEAYFAQLDKLPGGFRAEEAEAATQAWRSQLDKARQAIEDGFEKLLNAIDKASREQGGVGLSKLARREAKLLIALRLERHRELVREADLFWDLQRRAAGRVDPADVEAMRLRLAKISRKYEQRLHDQYMKFYQACFRHERERVPTPAQREYARRAMRFKEAVPEPVSPATVGEARAAEQAAAVEARHPPSIEELKRQREAVQVERLRLEREAVDVQQLLALNPSYHYTRFRTVSRPRRLSKFDIRPRMTMTKQMLISDQDLLAILRQRGVPMEPARPPRMRRVKMRKLGTPEEEQARLAALRERLPRLKGERKADALRELMMSLDREVPEQEALYREYERRLDQVLAKLPKQEAAEEVAITPPLAYWVDFQDEVWGADRWLSEALGARAEQYSLDDAENLVRESWALKKQLEALNADIAALERRERQLSDVIRLGEEAFGEADPNDPIVRVERLLQGKIADLDQQFEALMREAEAGRIPADIEERKRALLVGIGELDTALRHVREARTLQTNLASGAADVADMVSTVAAEARDALLDLQRTRAARFEELKGDIMKLLLRPRFRPEQEAALRDYLDAIATRLERLPADRAATYKQAYRQAAKGAIEDLKRAFVNYDDRNVVDWTLQHIFPFWTYESRRYPYLMHQVLTKPAVAKVVIPMVGDPEAGQWPVPGTDFQFGLLRGTVFGGVRRLPVPGTAGAAYLFFPPREEGPLGVVQKAEEALASLGFYFGPHITLPLSIIRHEVGEALPAPFATVVGLGAALGVPGAAALQQRFLHDPWIERDINQVLLNKGLVPSEVRTMANQGDPDAVAQLADARREANLRRVVAEQTSVLRYRPEHLEDIRRARYQAAVELGVPEPVARQRWERRQNPLTATDERGKYLLTPDQRMRGYERAAEIAGVDVEEVTALSELSEPLRSARQQEMTRQRHLYEIQNKAIMAWYEQEMSAIEQAFIPGLNGAQVREAITRLRQMKRGMRQQLNDPRGQFAQYVATFDDPERLAREEGETVLFNLYMQAITDPALTDELGRYDHEARRAIDESFRARYGERVFERLQERLHRDEHPLERELRLDAEKLEEYWDLQDALWDRFTRSIPSLAGMGYQDYIEAVQRQAVEAGLDPRRHPGWAVIDRFQELLQDVREVYRRRHPDVNAILIKWGYMETATTPEAQRQFAREYGFIPRLGR